MILTTLILTIGLGADARAEDSLLRALRGLQTRVRIAVPEDRAAAAAIETPAAVLAATMTFGLATRLPGFPWQVLGFPTRYLLRKAGEASAYAVFAGGAMYLGAVAYRLVRAARERGLDADYHTADGLRRFFTSPLDEQYLIAARDPEFTRFLIDLDYGFDAIDHGFVPNQPTREAR